MTLQKCASCLESIEKSRELARQIKCEVNTSSSSIDKLERLLQMSPLDLPNNTNAIYNSENIYVVKLLEKLMDLCISVGRFERALQFAIYLTRSYELVKFLLFFVYSNSRNLFEFI